MRARTLDERDVDRAAASEAVAELRRELEAPGASADDDDA
jgi:hypothetical protein